MYEERTRNLNKVKQYKEKLEAKEKMIGDFSSKEKAYLDKIAELQKQIQQQITNAETRSKKCMALSLFNS